MLEERLDRLKLPKPARGPINDLVRALNAASIREDIEREGVLQMEVIRELEAGKRIKVADIETLYMIFDDEVQERLKGLLE